MDPQWRKKWEREEDEEGLDETGAGGVCTLQSKYDFPSTINIREPSNERKCKV